MTRLLLAVAALALVGAGCGAVEDDPNLAEAAAKTEATGSSRFAVGGTDAAGTQPVEITCTGEANYASERVHVRCDYGPSETVEMVAVGRVTYMRGSILGFAGAGDKWVKNEGDSLGTDLSPQHLLAMLRRASQSTERLGEEQVRAVETTRYRLVVDCEQAELDCESDTSSVDVWIDGDGIVRKIEVTEGTSPFTFEFYDFGADLAIEAPPASDVVTIDGGGGGLGTQSGSSCTRREPRPVTLQVTLEALRAHGFTVESTPFCTAGVDMYMIQTALDSSSANTPTEVFVSCTLMGSARQAAPAGVDLGGSVTALKHENLECRLVGDGAAGAEALRSLRDAFDEIRDESRS